MSTRNKNSENTAASASFRDVAALHVLQALLMSNPHWPIEALADRHKKRLILCEEAIGMADAFCQILDEREESKKDLKKS